VAENGVHDSQLLKGVLSLALLRLLADRESYGYELVTSLHDLGLTEVQDGSVYPALAGSSATARSPRSWSLPLRRRTEVLPVVG